MSNKRVHEHAQLRKEEYEELDSQEANSVGTFARAPEEVVKKRRMVQLSKKWVKEPRLNNTSSNPFASVSFASAPPSSLPVFKAATFASKPSDTISASKPSEPISASKPSEPTFGSKPPPSNGISYQDQLNLSFLYMAEMEGEHNPGSDWTCWIQKYVALAEIAEANMLSDNSQVAVEAPTAVNSGDTEKGEKGEDVLEEVTREINADKDCLYEVRSRYMKLVNREWKLLHKGVLRLYRRKSTGSCCLVLRDDIGRVQLNVGVVKGMKFEKVVQKQKGYIRFAAVQEESVGLEAFMLMVKLENLDELLTKLHQIAR